MSTVSSNQDGKHNKPFFVNWKGTIPAKTLRVRKCCHVPILVAWLVYILHLLLKFLPLNHFHQYASQLFKVIVADTDNLAVLPPSKLTFFFKYNVIISLQIIINHYILKERIYIGPDYQLFLNYRPIADSVKFCFYRQTSIIGWYTGASLIKSLQYVILFLLLN